MPFLNSLNNNYKIHMLFFKKVLIILKLSTKFANLGYEGQHSLKGVLHPILIVWLFVYFSQNLQHIGDK